MDSTKEPAAFTPSKAKPPINLQIPLAIPLTLQSQKDENNYTKSWGERVRMAKLKLSGHLSRTRPCPGKQRARQHCDLCFAAYTTGFACVTFDGCLTCRHRHNSRRQTASYRHNLAHTPISPTYAPHSRRLPRTWHESIVNRPFSTAPLCGADHFVTLFTSQDDPGGLRMSFSVQSWISANAPSRRNIDQVRG
jgi:hypothetical protein